MKRGRKPKPKSAESLARSAAMAARYRDGETLQEIGASYGITRERVRQLLKGAISAREGGASERHRRLKSAWLVDRDKRYLATKGCTFAQYAELRGKPTKCYSMQRKNAERRGIKWEFTFWTWWKVWEQSGHCAAYLAADPMQEAAE